MDSTTVDEADTTPHHSVGSRPRTYKPEPLDETRSVKVGLDRDELMAEFALLAEEERAEMERVQAIFIEAVQHLQRYSHLDVETISHLLAVLEDSGRDEAGAWEYFFREGMHQVLLVLLNAGEVVEDAGRSDQILRLWERIFRFVLKLSEADQGVVYDELRRQGMVETLTIAMCLHPANAPIQRRAAFLLIHLYDNDLKKAAQGAHDDEDPEDPPVAQRMVASVGLLDRLSAMEANPTQYTPDLLSKMREIRESLSQKQQKGGNDEEDEKVETQKKDEKEEKTHHNVEHNERQGDSTKEPRPSLGSPTQQRIVDRSPTGDPRSADRLGEERSGNDPRPPSVTSEKQPLLTAGHRHAAHQVITGDGWCSACLLM